jgi:hypothetical protein
MLQSQPKSMVAMAFHIFTTFEIQDTFLVGKVKINNERLNKVKIKNLKTFKKLTIISKDEFIIVIKTILNL